MPQSFPNFADYYDLGVQMCFMQSPHTPKQFCCIFVTMCCHSLLEVGNKNCAFLQIEEHPQRLTSSSGLDLKPKFKIRLLHLLLKRAFKSVRMWKIFSVRKTQLIYLFLQTEYVTRGTRSLHMYESYPYEFYCSCCFLCESAAGVAK